MLVRRNPFSMSKVDRNRKSRHGITLLDCFEHLIWRSSCSTVVTTFRAHPPRSVPATVLAFVYSQMRKNLCTQWESANYSFRLNVATRSGRRTQIIPEIIQVLAWIVRMNKRVILTWATCPKSLAGWWVIDPNEKGNFENSAVPRFPYTWRQHQGFVHRA